MKRAARWSGMMTLGLLIPACIDRPVNHVSPVLQRAIVKDIENNVIDKVDLLVMVDNSNSMENNQRQIFSRLPAMINTLTRAECVSAANPTRHPCDDNDMNERKVRPAVRDLHVGIVSSDLGTRPNLGICGSTDRGDDGLLNPITRGPATMMSMPRTLAPTGFYPPDCDPVAEYKPFLEFHSDGPTPTDPATFAKDFVCNAGLYIKGCYLEQQLESVHRALIVHDARNIENNSSPNAGFVRDDALLAILMLSDEEDGSIRDCNYATGGDCVDASDVFASGVPASDPNRYDSFMPSRFYFYQPENYVGSPLYDTSQHADPTWNLDRYVNPRRGHEKDGWLALKCPNGPESSDCHPERIVFAAITGIPKNVPPRADGKTNWDLLLGTPSSDPNNFGARDPSGAYEANTPEGPVSMRPNNPNTSCGQVTDSVPACRRGGTWDPAHPVCTSNSQQYLALPSRRIVEIARRFDQMPFCKGQACGNGLVTSICDDDYVSAMDQITNKITSNLQTCFVEVLATKKSEHNPEANTEADCFVRLTQPLGVTTCDASRGLKLPDESGVEGERTVMIDGHARTVCVMRQVPVNNTTLLPDRSEVTEGWYYDRSEDAHQSGCERRIVYTQRAQPLTDSITRLECIAPVGSAGADAGATEGGSSTGP